MLRWAKGEAALGSIPLALYLGRVRVMGSASTAVSIARGAAQSNHLTRAPLPEGGGSGPCAPLPVAPASSIASASPPSSASSAR